MRQAAIGILVALAGCGTSTFHCLDADDCGAGGACQPNGFCSFPDVECESGQRFGEHAPSGIAGMCVPLGDETDGTTSPTSSESGPQPSTTVSPSTSSSTSMPATSEPSTSGDPSTGMVVETTEGSSSTGEEELDPDLVAWYRFEDRIQQATDETANALHGVCAAAGCGTPVEGVVGQGVHLDGDDDHFRVADAPELHTTEGWTVALWLRNDDPALDRPHNAIAKPIGSMYANSYEIWFAPVDGSVRLYVGGGTVGLNQAIEIVPEFGDTWAHVAGTWDGVTLAMYVDGEWVGGIDSLDVDFDDHDLFLGADQNLDADPGSNFNGSLDEVRIYGRALDSTEIAELYELEVAGG